jgi:hypothetical protein
LTSVDGEDDGVLNDKHKDEQKEVAHVSDDLFDHFEFETHF